MTEKVMEYRYDWHTGKRNPYKSHEVSGDTEAEMFKNFYAGFVRPNRYCSDVSNEFVNPEVQKRYEEWRKTGVTIELYYGNGTVD